MNGDRLMYFQHTDISRGVFEGYVDDDAKEAIDDIKHNQRNMINSDLYQCMWTGSNAQ